jgi:hypothetical protein
MRHARHSLACRRRETNVGHIFSEARTARSGRVTGIHSLDVVSGECGDRFLRNAGAVAIGDRMIVNRYGATPDVHLEVKDGRLVEVVHSEHDLAVLLTMRASVNA